jgi:hypothetical protein
MYVGPGWRIARAVLIPSSMRLQWPNRERRIDSTPDKVESRAHLQYACPPSYQQQRAFNNAPTKGRRRTRHKSYTTPLKHILHCATSHSSSNTHGLERNATAQPQSLANAQYD